MPRTLAQPEEHVRAQPNAPSLEAPLPRDREERSAESLDRLAQEGSSAPISDPLESAGRACGVAVEVAGVYGFTRAALDAIPSSTPPRVRRGVAVATAAVGLLGQPQTGAFIRDGIRQEIARAYSGPVNEETNRPPYPREDWVCGSVENRVRDRQEPALGVIGQSNNPASSEGPSGPKDARYTDATEPPENPFGPSSALEFIQWEHYDLLYLFTWAALFAVFFLTAFFIKMESPQGAQLESLFGRKRALALGMRATQLVWALKLLSLFCVFVFFYSLNCVSHYPLHSEPHTVTIIKSAYNFAITLSAYTLGIDLISFIEKIVSKITGGQSGFARFLHKFSKSLIHSPVMFFVKLACCVYLVVALFYLLLYAY